jgi:hypothetical protein
MGKPSVTEANEMWSAMDAMAKALMAAGFGRPKKAAPPKEQLVIEDEHIGTLPNFAPPGSEAHRAYQRQLDDYAARQKAVDRERSR